MSTPEPLSYAQQSLWFMAQLVPDHPFYNLPWALTLRGPLDLGALRRTFQALVARHDALRTVFLASDGRPLQEVLPEVPLALPLLVAEGPSLPARRERARRMATEEGQRPFSLSHGPLVRVVLIQVDPDEHVLAFTLHHIVADGWSLGVLAAEIPVLYDAFRHGRAPELPGLTATVRDHARAQRELHARGGLDAGLRAWSERLREVPGLALPTDHSRPPLQRHVGGRIPISLPAPLVTGLEALARAEGCTLFMVMLAAFHALLARLSGQDQTIVGTPVAGRDRRDWEGIVGFFANSLPLVCDHRGVASFRELLRRVRGEVVGAFERREVPFEALVEHLHVARDPSKNPLFQVMFALQRSSADEIRFPGLEAEVLQLDDPTTHFDMEWHLWQKDGGLHGYASYNVDLYEAPTVMCWAVYYGQILEAVVADPDRPLGEVRLWTPRDALVASRWEQGGAPSQAEPGSSAPGVLYAPPEAPLPAGLLDPRPGEEPPGPRFRPAGSALRIRTSGGPSAPLLVAGDIEVKGPDGAWTATGETGRLLPDGRLELNGGRGRPVWRGARVELAALAEAALRHPLIGDAAAEARLGLAGLEPQLWVVPARDTPRAALESALRSALGAPLPAWTAVASIRRDAQGRPAVTTPPLTEAITERWERLIRAVPGVADAAVRLIDVERPIGRIHQRDLLPGWRQAPSLVESAGLTPPAQTELDRPPATSSGGSLALPADAPRTLCEALIRAAGRDRGLRCLEDDGSERRYPYAELLERARRALAGLRAAGLGPGDRVILQIDRLGDHFACFWGAVLGGIVPVTVAVPPTYDERNGVVNKLWNTALLLRGPTILCSARLGEGLRGVPGLYPEVSGPPWRLLSAEALLSHGPARELHEPEPGDVVFYQLTSGSTGVPKCIQETHRGVLHHVYGSARQNGYADDDVTLNWLPMDHVVPILTCHLKDVVLGLEQIHARTGIVLAQPLRWLDLIERHRVTHTWSPNFGFKRVNDALRAAPERRWDLSSLKFAMNAGEQVTLPVVREWIERCAPFGVAPQVMQPAFGMAEVCTCMTYTNDFTPETGAHWAHKSTLGGSLRWGEPGSRETTAFIDLGPPIPGVEIRITDAANRVVPEGTIGRLQIRGAVTTPGYLDNPAANAEAFVGDGWFNSGDLGFMWRGRLTLTGREKEIIIVRGANFYCYEIEDVVNGIPGVLPTFSAAIALPDPTTGTEGLAVFFVPQTPGLDLALIERIRETVGRELGISPGVVVPLDERAFPKTTSGKIQRTQLKRSFEAGAFDGALKEIDLGLGRPNTVPAWFYTRVWVESPAPQPARLEAGSTLVWGGSSGLVAALRRQLPGEIIHWDSSPREETRLEGLVASPPLRIVVRGREGLAADLLWLSRGLARRAPGPLTLIVIDERTQAVSPGEPVRAARALVQALVGVLPQELVGLRARHVDVAPDLSDDDLAHILHLELATPSREPAVAWRGSRRLAPRLRPLPFPAQGAGLRLNPGSTWIIAGGLGGIGRLLGRHLLQTLGGRLVLLQRRAPEAEGQRALAELRALGEVELHLVDVADEAALRRVQRDRDLGAPGAVFHLAGTFEPAPLVSLDDDALARGLRAKVEGTRALRAVFPHPTPLVAFGSVNAFFPGVTAAVYAAASRGQEAIIEDERQRGHHSAFSIGFSLWDEVGMSRGYAMREASRAQGFLPIDPARGLLSAMAVLEAGAGVSYVGLDASRSRVRAALAEGPAALWEPVAWVATRPGFDPAALDRLRLDPRPTIHVVTRLPRRADGSLDEGAHRASEGAEPASAEASTPTERLIAGVWREVLGLPSVDVRRNFFELGGESVLLVAVHARLCQLLGRDITVVELLRSPTVSSLARRLDEEQRAAPSFSRAEQRGQRQQRAVAARRPDWRGDR